MSVNLMKWLKSPLPLNSLYYVVGQENFLISEIKRTLIKEVHRGNKLVDFNHDEVSANEISIEDLLALAETLPFMSEKRLIFCDKAELFRDRDWEKLFSFVAPAFGTAYFCLVFWKKRRKKKTF